MSKIIDLSIKMAKEAGVLLKDNFGKIKEIQKKGDRNFATNLDREAENLIVAAIRSDFPEHGVIAEESGSSNLDSDYLWIIDPLDGTHNYMRNVAVFGVSIGVVYKKEFIGGVIYMPMDDELYVAEKGAGAYKNGERISVSDVSDLKNCSISFDSSIRYSPELMLTTLGALSREVFNVRMYGSSVRALTYIAEGKIDFSVEFHDRPWDFAGGVCLIEEAGGKLIDLKGGKLTPETIGYLASNSNVFQAVKELIIPQF
ncbi:MAG: inositol monophosphatase [Candidatus Omnitrophica bacterium]|nr:inositol monophosphatase [Candidatus Omnitrophota bacterium]